MHSQCLNIQELYEAKIANIKLLFLGILSYCQDSDFRNLDCRNFVLESNFL